MANDKKVRIRWKMGALYRLRSGTAPDSGKVQDELEQWAEKVAAKANRISKTGGYKTSSRQGKRKPQGRWRTTVITANAKAMRDNMKNNTLTKALFSEQP